MKFLFTCAHLIIANENNGPKSPHILVNEILNAQIILFHFLQNSRTAIQIFAFSRAFFQSSCESEDTALRLFITDQFHNELIGKNERKSPIQIALNALKFYIYDHISARDSCAQYNPRARNQFEAFV